MILKNGSTGKAVEELQLNLSRVGYLTNIDGEFGSDTRNNLKAFQADHSLKADGIYGPLTQDVMAKELAGIPKSKEPTPVDKSDTPWMTFIERNMGEKEIPGTRANQFIVDCFQYTSLANTKWALSDETAWCAALANAALRKNGYKGTNSALAASFDRYGVALDKPKYGCVLTLRHPSGGRHVTFFAGYNSQGRMRCWGGNQSNALKESLFSKSELVAARWPVKL